MTNGGAFLRSARITTRPSATEDVMRTRSVWMMQLILAAAVIIISVLVLALQPRLFAQWNFAAGVLLVIAVSLLSLALPWSRLPALAVLAVPFADALAVGLISSGTDLRLGYLWVFPVMWVAMHFGPLSVAAMLATITFITLVDLVGHFSSSNALRVIIVTLSLSFTGITAHMVIRQMRAFRRLQLRQSRRLTATVKRHSEQEREATEILNGVDVGVARISLSGRVLAVNDAYSKLYGLDPADPNEPGKSVEYTRLRGMPVPLTDRPQARAARGETFTDARVWLFTPAGEWRALSITAKRLGGSRHDQSSTLLLVHDVTAITYAQRERERLTAIASHELKHPLTVMMGNAELALESDDLTPRMRKRLETMLAAGERMLEMTTQMLTSARPDQTTRPALDEFDLRRILIDSVESFRPTARALDVSIDMRLDMPLPATADSFRLRQVIDNLLSNAIKYTPREGEVQIVGAVDEDAIAVTVADTGIGISAEDLPKIMTPYFRAADAKHKSGGTGLGLSISRDIVAAHGGTLTVDSAAGRGTTVTVRLPHALAEASAPPQEVRP